MWRRGGLVLAALGDDQVQAGEGDQLGRRGEGLDGIGFAEEADDAERAGPGQGHQVIGQAFGQGFDFALELLADGLEGIQLGQQQPDADAGGVEAAVGADGVFGGLADLVGLGGAVLAA